MALSLRFLKQFHVCPVGEDEGHVDLLMADPQDHYAIEAVRLATGRAVRPRVALRSEISDLIERYYGQGSSAMGAIVENLGDDGAGDEADRRFVRVLAAVLDDGLEAVDEAVREALDAGVSSDDLILNILARRREPPKPPGITTSEALQLRYPPVADCARYDRLRGSHATA